MKNYSTSPLKLTKSLWRYRDLCLSLIEREVVGRYRGSTLGVFWSFFNPLLMLTVYTFFFGFVFNSRWSNATTSKTEFAIILFSGLILFNLFTECVTKAPTIIVSNPNYVKKIVFPLEIVAVVIVGSALFHFIVSFIVWLLFYTTFIGIPSSTILILPILIIPYILFLVGCTWALAALGVIVKDLVQVTSFVTTSLMFTSPVFFSMSSLPKKYYELILINPLSWFIESARDLMIYGTPPHLFPLLIYSLFCVLVFLLGFFIFQKTRHWFADII